MINICPCYQRQLHLLACAYYATQQEYDSNADRKTLLNHIKINIIKAVEPKDAVVGSFHVYSLIRAQIESNSKAAKIKPGWEETKTQTCPKQSEEERLMVAKMQSLSKILSACNKSTTIPQQKPQSSNDVIEILDSDEEPEAPVKKTGTTDLTEYVFSQSSSEDDSVKEESEPEPKPFLKKPRFESDEDSDFVGPKSDSVSNSEFGSDSESSGSDSDYAASKTKSKPKRKGIKRSRSKGYGASKPKSKPKSKSKERVIHSDSDDDAPTPKSPPQPKSKVRVIHSDSDDTPGSDSKHKDNKRGRTVQSKEVAVISLDSDTEEEKPSMKRKK
jgi:hypothetical protein